MNNIQCGAPKLAFSWFITTISLGFMVVITIVRWGYKPTNITFGGPTLFFIEFSKGYTNPISLIFRNRAQQGAAWLRLLLSVDLLRLVLV